MLRSMSDFNVIHSLCGQPVEVTEAALLFLVSLFMASKCCVFELIHILFYMHFNF